VAAPDAFLQKTRVLPTAHPFRFTVMIFRDFSVQALNRAVVFRVNTPPIYSRSSRRRFSGMPRLGSNLRTRNETRAKTG
jgi:hypothetical protein